MIPRSSMKLKSSLWSLISDVKGQVPASKWRQPSHVDIPNKPRIPRRHRASFPVLMSSSFGAETTMVSATHSSISAPSTITKVEGSSSDRGQELEEHVERVIYRFRFMTLLGVLGSLLGSVLCFLKGCGYVVSSFAEYFVSSGKVTLMLVEAIDIYLLGTVMLVFGMGLYELFISNLDIAQRSPCRSNLFGMFMLPERPKWLEIKSVNELKTKLGHVIVMVLLLGLLEKSKKVTIASPRDLLCFAASVLLSSCGLYLLSKLQSSK